MKSTKFTRFVIIHMMIIFLLSIPAFAQNTPPDAQKPVPDTLKKYIMTPPAPKEPRINGPKIFGVRPGSIFLYTIPATGEKPLKFSAEYLPAGLKLDPVTGQITGKLSKSGEYKVNLIAKNSLGQDTRKFTIVVGEKIALTPPLGWNSWNCWGAAVSQEKVLSSAKAMVDKGLGNYGWTYINIDDGWQATRGGRYNAIQPNRKFPNMSSLAEHIHSMGLKFGIYSTPWRGTYAGHIGSSGDFEDGTYDFIKAGNFNKDYRIDSADKRNNSSRRLNYVYGKYSFVENDVKQWVEWGVDYLKYDWKPNDIYHTGEMMKALRGKDRDIVYSLSNAAPFDTAAEWAKMANCWRTTGDIRDNWKNFSTIGFAQDKWAPFTGPGHWSDPDMLVIGLVGWGPNLHFTRLTVPEQYTHISLWCLLSAPLLIGCDIAAMDEFTLGLLTNRDVLDIDQDPLGIQATQVSNENNKIVYSKKLEDGSLAVGLFNLGESKTNVSVSWQKLGIKGTKTVRDLWRQKDIGSFSDSYSAEVEPHGVVLVKISPEK